MKVTYIEEFPLAQVNEADAEFQARLDYDEEEISRLTEDIKRNGQRNPIGLWKQGDGYKLLYGFQRVKACKKLCFATVKTNVYQELMEEEAREQSISDNVRHGDLTDLEKATECLKLKEKGYSVGQLCELFGVKKSVIYNFCAVSDLDIATKYCLQKGFITLNHAVELARLNEISKRLESLRDVVAWGWSVRDLKVWLKEGRSPPMTAWLHGWIPLCPKTMQAEAFLEYCKKCEYHNGKNEEGKVGCAYPNIPTEILPLLHKKVPPGGSFIIPKPQNLA